MSPNALPAIVAIIVFSVASIEPYDPLVDFAPPSDTRRMVLFVSSVRSNVWRSHMFDSLMRSWSH